MLQIKTFILSALWQDRQRRTNVKLLRFLLIICSSLRRIVLIIELYRSYLNYNKRCRGAVAPDVASGCSWCHDGCCFDSYSGKMNYFHFFSMVLRQSLVLRSVIHCEMSEKMKSVEISVLILRSLCIPYSMRKIASKYLL